MSASPAVEEYNAALPEPFVAILYARHSGDFYDQQAREWEAVATGECSTDEAWWHYYKTAHYSNRFGSGDHDLKAILAAAEKQLDPEGFELNYLRFVDDPDPTTRYPHLLKAHAAAPNRLEAATGLAAYYTTTGELEARKDILQRMHAAHPLPGGVMEYNYNQLMSVAANGVLITHGDSDTYPSWILQSVYGVRPDVSVVSYPLLLGFESYREQVREEVGLDRLFTGMPRTAAGLLEELSAGQRPVFFATTGQHLLDDLPADRLFVTGLAFRYSKTPIDNLGQLAGHFNDDWRLENLQNPFDNSPGQAVADQLNLNYLPALFELHAYHRDNPSPAFRKNLRLIQSIGNRAGRAEEVAVYLRGTPEPGPLASSEPGVRAKDIFKALRFVPPGELRKAPKEPTVSVNGFFMQETEVSNADYQLFLEDLLRQRRFDLLDSVAVEQADLADLLPPEVYTQIKAIGLAQYDLAAPDKPIVNISHAAARLYARWLTEVYNNDPKRKDERKLYFRLPTAEEREFAARGGKVDAPYPWGGPYFANSKGCLLANFNTLVTVTEKDLFGEGKPYRSRWVDINGETREINKESAVAQFQKYVDNGCELSDGHAADGGLITTYVTAYYPNDYGLYNMSGNAAEMLAEKGVVAGGSWIDPAYYMQIDVLVNRTLPHPSTGFRLVASYTN